MNDSTGAGRWYTAVLVVSSEVVPRESDATPLIDLQYRLVRAATDEDAYQLALEIGSREAHSYPNAAGDNVRWVFKGLHDLIELDAAPTGGTEVYSRRVRGDAAAFVLPKARLSCFFLDAHASEMAAELLADESRLSIHDSLLTGYEVDGKKRIIVMHTEPHQGGGEAFVDVIFTGVVAYQFEGDAMANIIFEIEPASARFREKLPEVIIEQHRLHGWMPEWNPKAETLQQHCDRNGLEILEIHSSYGLCGWVIAAAIEHRLVSDGGASL